jgi:hypothetical protein
VREATDGSETPTVDAADALKDYVESSMPDLGACMWSDLLQSAFDDVDWHEIAEHYLEESR